MSKLIAVLIIGLIVLIGTYFGRNIQNPPENIEAIRLGITVPLVGDFASYGQLIRRGVELAQEDLRKFDGIKVSLFFENACLPPEAVSAINKLVYADKIHALAANFCVIAMPPMASVINKEKLIAFHTASLSDSILHSSKFVFGTNIVVRDEAIKLAEYAWNEMGAKTASVLFIATDFGEDYNTYFSKRFEELGGVVLTSERAAPGINDFRTELTRIRSKQPDILFAAHLGGTLGMLLKQKQIMGITSEVLGVYEAEDPGVIDVAGSAAEGLRFFTPEPLEDTETIRTFRERYQTKFGDNPTILVTNAYDATTIAVKALSECQLDSECTQKSISQIRNYDGVSGRFSIDPTDSAKRPLVLKTIQGGKFVRVN